MMRWFFVRQGTLSKRGKTYSRTLTEAREEVTQHNGKAAIRKNS